MAPMDNFRRYMAPDFQAPQGLMMDWQPMESQSQGAGQDIGSILQLLKPSGGQSEAQGFGTKDIIGGGARKTGGGMNSL